MKEEWHLEEYSSKEHGEKSFYYHGRIPLGTRLKFWGLVAAGAAIGTFLFLFFLTIFVYVFLPVAALLILYSAVRRLMQR